MLGASPKARGFSLVEVLIALLLLVVGLGGALGLYTRQINAVGNAQRRLQAENIARARLAEVQAEGYEMLLTRHLIGDTRASKLLNETTAAPSSKTPAIAPPSFRRSVQIEGLAADADNALPPRIRITVRVEWAAGVAAKRKHLTSGEAIGYVVSP